VEVTFNGKSGVAGKGDKLKLELGSELKTAFKTVQEGQSGTGRSGVVGVDCGV